MDTIIIAILSSGALSALITGLFQLLQTRKSRKTGLESKVDTLVEEQGKVMKAQKKQEGDILRVELRLLISDFPDKEDDILRLGEHYFNDLHANWVMYSVYKQWLTQRDLPTPPWFTND
jgi:hypothetical protein